MKKAARSKSRTRRSIIEKISSKQRLFFEGLIKKKISIILFMMYGKPEEVVDIKSGEEYICAQCTLEYQRCKVEPDYRCEMALKNATELKELELALDRLRKGTFGYCQNCSSFIGIAELEKAPTRTYCDMCARKN